MSTQAQFVKAVSTLPRQLDKNTFYAVRVGRGYDLHLSDATGNVAYPLNPTKWVQLTTVQDLNTLTETGCYFITIGGNTNAPVNTWIYVIVESYDSSRIIQTVYGDVDVNEYWVRTKYGTSWKPWHRYAKLPTIGGRNLLRNTAKLTDTYLWHFTKHASQTATEQPRTNESLTIKSDTAFWVQYYQRSDRNPTLINELEGGKEYTISFEAKCSNIEKEYIRFFARQIYTGGSNQVFKGFTATTVNQWERFEFTFTLPNKHEKHLYFMFIFEINHRTAGQFEFRKVKLERGNIATDWTPAFEDTQEEFNTVSKQVQLLYTQSRNLLKGSNPNINNANYMHRFELTETPKIGEKFTVTLWGSMGADRTGIGIYNTQGFNELIKLTQLADGVYQGTGTWGLPMNGSTPRVPNNTHLNVYFYPNTGTSVNNISRIKMEMGETGSGWSPSPEELIQRFETIEARLAELEKRVTVSGNNSGSFGD